MSFFSNNTSKKLARVFLWIVLIFYMGILTKLVVFKKSLPFIKNHLLNLFHHYSWKAVKSNMHNGNFNMKPFATIKMYMADNMPVKYAILNLLGNIAGFIPLGLLLPLLFVKMRSAISTISAIFLISLCFEIFQLFAMLGVCDIDDLMLNTLGGIIGYVLFLLLKKMIHSGGQSSISLEKV